MTGRKDENETQKAAQGHGLTSEEARKAGMAKGNLQPGKDFVVEHGREINSVGQAENQDNSAPTTYQKLSNDVNDDDISQRKGSKE